MIDVRQNREDFIAVFNSEITSKYPEAKNLLDWLLSTDFFTAPASTKYHSAEPGGLCYHSLLVFDRLWDLVELPTFSDIMQEFDKSDIAIAALCHDLCKVQLYKTATKNVKDTSTGVDRWVVKSYYIQDEQFIYGHGEKSVFYIMKFINTVPDKTLQAIRYHMGGLNGSTVDQNTSPVFATNKLALALHLADMTATFACEERSE